jgi:rRNA biogenesis protein RRP5
MADEDEEMEPEEEDDDDDDDDSADEAEEEEEMDDDEEDAEEDEEDEEESDEDDADVLEGDDDVDTESDDDDDSEDDDDSDDEDSEDEDSDSDDKAAVDEDIGFDWDDDKAGKNEDGDDSDEDEGPKSKSKSKRERAKEKAQKELELHRREQALRDKADAAPETAQDFEKLILSSPRSSYVWLRFMAFQMSVAAYDEARSVAERAIKAIPADDEDERMNVWVAYLNLENLHGKPSPREALLKLFDRATKVANPKKLHLTLAGIYERSGQDDMAAQTLKTATRRFGQSAKVWLAHIRAHILHVGDKNADPESVRKALDRATQSLPKRKHVKVLVQTALLEIREGSVERGRTMFESILRNYPKRTDIWSTYIDQEIKQGDPDRTRSLLERATHLDLNPKSMKFLFKRYLNFEREAGDKQRIAHVKQRAMDYVAQKFG